MRTVLFSAVALFFIMPLTRSDAQPAIKEGDWPQWRGPQRDAICTETGLLREWPKGGPALLWDSKKVNKVSSVGVGLSSLAIVNGKIYTMGDVAKFEQVEFKDKEGKVGKKNANKGNACVFCLDAETGKEIWQTVIGPISAGGPRAGPRSTPTVDGDRVYALSTQGRLVCLKISDGANLWQKELVKDLAGTAPGFGGYSESPLIDGDKLICTTGGKKACMVALNKLTGDTYWTCEKPLNNFKGFSSIVKAEVGGVKQYITLANKQLGLIGVDAETGKFLWNYPRIANDTSNAPTPLVKGEFVFASTGYKDGGSALLKLVPTGNGGIKVEEQYYFDAKQLQNHHGGMVMLGDYIYGGHGHNDGKPFCLEWKTGKFAWTPQRGAGTGSAAVLYADQHLYFRYENGDMALVEASPKGYSLKSSFRPNISGNGWPHPVIYHGKLYLRGDDQILCYDIKQK